MTSSSLGRRRGAALFVLFFVSGAASLVYQILWVRELSLVLGSTVFAVSAVVAAFMAGLALGSDFWGRHVDRFGSALRLYAFLEGGIGLLALGVPIAFRGIAGIVSRSGAGSSAGAGSTWIPFVAGFLVVLVPAFLMGGTLPVLGRYMAGFKGSRGRLVGALYALNTAGAVLGTAITGFFLIRALGIRNSTYLAASLNLLVLILSYVLSRVWPGQAPAPTADPARKNEPEKQLLIPITVAYFINGFTGLALEVLWTRAVLLFTSNTIYAFTTILTTFLVGIALGSSIMAAGVHRIRHAPAFFAGLQCVLGLVAGLTPLALGWVGGDLFEFVQTRSVPLGSMGQALAAFVVSATFVLPSAMLLGASFPLVARVAADYTSKVGGAVGRVYALNTVGAVLGSVLSTFVLLPWIGIQKSIVVSAGLCSLAGLYLALRSRAYRGVGFAGFCVLALGVVLVASPNHFQDLLARSLRAKLLFYREGLETTVAVYESRKAQRRVLVINNVALGDKGVVHKMLAHLPALLHPDPQRALVLGFGVGISSESLSSQGIPVNDCVEISPAVMEAAPHFARLNRNIAGRDDPRFRVYLADGRRFLLSHGRTYDVIALDANSGKLRNAGVGKLYTREFFQLCRDRLSPNGMVTAYASPNGTLREFKMIVKTFQSVFPHTTLWVDPVYGETCVLLGSMQPLRIDAERYLKRLREPAVQADLEIFDLDQPGTLLSSFWMGEDRVRLFCTDGEVNTDDRPIMEFYALDMDRFEVDDHPLSDAGLPLYKEPVLAYVDWQDDTDRSRIVAFLQDNEKAFSSVLNAWFIDRLPGSDPRRDLFERAAELHPQAEYLRTRLGYGRRDRAGAEQASVSGRARLAWITARRREPSGYTLLQDALSATTTTGGSTGGIAPGVLQIEAARSALAHGDVDASRVYLDAAEKQGIPVALDRLELELARSNHDGLETVRDGLAGLPLRPEEAARVLALGRHVLSSGDMEDRILALVARSLEILGDAVGARVAYRDLLARNPGSPQIQAALRATEIELALRADVFRLAPTPGMQPVFESPFTGAQVAASELPVLGHRDADAWLELHRLYGESKRFLEAYRSARAARTFEPERPEIYLAVGQAAVRIGGRSIARLAYERALELGGDEQTVRTALRALSRE